MTDPAAAVPSPTVLPADVLTGWSAEPGTVSVAAIRDGAVHASIGDVHAVYPLASVTKPLVAWGALVAVEEGSIALDEPAGPPGSTVRHLLCHASGVPFEEGGPVVAPASRRIYSNFGYELLARHLEASTGMPWARYLAGAVLEPLGMASTTPGESPGAGAHSNVADLIRFVAEVRSPALLAPSTVADALSVQFPGLRGIVPGLGPFDPNPWGLGVEIRGDKAPHWTSPTCSARTVGHFGAAGTFWWFDPHRDRAVIGLGRRPFGKWALEVWPLLDHALFG